jgi:hypothetical protein
MKTSTRKIMTGISIVALIVAALLAMGTGADPDMASGLGPDWQCRRLPYINICQQITEDSGKRLRALRRAVTI